MTGITIRTDAELLAPLENFERGRCGGNRGPGVMDDKWARIVKSGGSMASDAIPPLEVYSGTSKYNKGSQTWIAETEVRAAHGGLIDRTIGALFLSAYLVNSDAFFVGPGARIRFNLSPDQFRRGWTDWRPVA